MLDFMRRQQSRLKWVWVGIIVIFSLGLVTFYIPFGDLGSISITNDVAQVGSEAVTAREFQTAYGNYMQQMQSELTPELRRAFGFDRQVLQYLIGQKVIASEAKRIGLQVAPEEIQRKILSNPVFLAGGTFIGMERYESLLSQNNLTVEQFEGAIGTELLTEKLLSFITSGVGVDDKEVEEEYRRRNEKAQLTYFVIDPVKLESKVVLTDKDKRDYYEREKTKYNVPEKRKSRYIFVETLKYRVQATATDEEIQTYYDEHSEEYRLPEQVTAQHILFKTEDKTPQEVEAIQKKATDVLVRAKNGEDFSKLAREFSEDSSAAQGGNLGTFGRGRMVPEFERAAFSLGAGAISDLVKSEFGFHIIKVTEKQEGRLRPLDEIKEAIRPVLLFRKGEDMAKEIADKINVDLATNPDLNAVAEKYEVRVNETPLLEQSANIPELGASTEYQNKIFTMTKDQVGTAVQTERGYAIPQVVDIQPAHPASFEEAEPKVVADLRAEKGRELATETANKLQEQIKNGTSDVAALAKSVGGDVKTSEMVTRSGSIPEFGSLTDRDQEIFSLPLGKVGTPANLAGKTLVFSVKKREEINPEEMAKSLDSLRKEMLPTKRQRYFAAYINEAQKRMEESKEISINETTMTKIAEQIR